MTKETDLEEAKHLIRQAVMATTRGQRRIAKNQAAAQLVEELLQLNTFCGIKVEKHDGLQVAITLNNRTAYVSYNKDDSSITVFSDSNNVRTDVELDLEPETNRFLGTTRDEFRMPVPGQAHAPRSAIAVVVELP